MVKELRCASLMRSWMVVSLHSSYDNISILLFQRQDQKLKVKEYLPWTMTPVKQARKPWRLYMILKPNFIAQKEKEFVCVFFFWPYLDMWFILDPFVTSVDRLIRLNMKYKSWKCVFVCFALNRAQHSGEYCFAFTTYTFFSKDYMCTSLNCSLSLHANTR